MTKTSNEHSPGEIGGQPLFGPMRPGQYGDQGSTWNFDGLNSTAANTDANGDAEVLVSTIDKEGDEEDAASTTAEMDTTGEDGFANRMDQDFDEFDNAQDSRWSTAGRNTPADSVDGWDNYQDNHGLYSTAHDTALHLEDAGTIGIDDSDGEPPVNIYPDPPSPMDHEKLD